MQSMRTCGHVCNVGNLRSYMTLLCHAHCRSLSLMQTIAHCCCCCKQASLSCVTHHHITSMMRASAFVAALPTTTVMRCRMHRSTDPWHVDVDAAEGATASLPISSEAATTRGAPSHAATTHAPERERAIARSRTTEAAEHHWSSESEAWGTTGGTGRTLGGAEDALHQAVGRHVLQLPVGEQGLEVEDNVEQHGADEGAEGSQHFQGLVSEREEPLGELVLLERGMGLEGVVEHVPELLALQQGVGHGGQSVLKSLDDLLVGQERLNVCLELLALLLALLAELLGVLTPLLAPAASTLLLGGTLGFALLVICRRSLRAALFLLGLLAFVLAGLLFSTALGLARLLGSSACLLLKATGCLHRRVDGLIVVVRGVVVRGLRFIRDVDAALLGEVSNGLLLRWNSSSVLGRLSILLGRRFDEELDGLLLALGLREGLGNVLRIAHEDAVAVLVDVADLLAGRSFAEELGHDSLKALKARSGEAGTTDVAVVLDLDRSGGSSVRAHSSFAGLSSRVSRSTRFAVPFGM
mmetsp:Transcript_31365/g.58482  ORF Transcript_31365/g.58482 Transcript_31365/m.58482 type:complete len:525 (+) Transcript_31365:127-1701(+)